MLINIETSCGFHLDIYLKLSWRVKRKVCSVACSVMSRNMREKNYSCLSSAQWSRLHNVTSAIVFIWKISPDLTYFLKPCFFQRTTPCEVPTGSPWKCLCALQTAARRPLTPAGRAVTDRQPTRSRRRAGRAARGRLTRRDRSSQRVSTTLPSSFRKACPP